jgi:hypothetical protein
MGLLGTAVMPILEKKLGLVRAGAWSIWCVPTQRSRRSLTILPVQ